MAATLIADLIPEYLIDFIKRVQAVLPRGGNDQTTIKIRFGSDDGGNVEVSVTPTPRTDVPIRKLWREFGLDAQATERLVTGREPRVVPKTWKKNK